MRSSSASSFAPVPGRTESPSSQSLPGSSTFSLTSSLKSSSIGESSIATSHPSSSILPSSVLENIGEPGSSSGSPSSSLFSVSSVFSTSDTQGIPSQSSSIAVSSPRTSAPVNESTTPKATTPAPSPVLENPSSMSSSDTRKASSPSSEGTSPTQKDDAAPPPSGSSSASKSSSSPPKSPSAQSSDKPAPSTSKVQPAITPSSAQSASSHVSGGQTAKPESTSAPTRATVAPSLGGANAQSPSISTVVDQPETTLSSPILISVTNDDRVTLSEPPIITSISESTLDNGVRVSVTHIIANPTGVWDVDGNAAIEKHGFWDNNGAVIAVFLISGILVATIAAVIGWCVCRKRRRRRIRQSISRPLPYPDNPFEDPRESPASSEMRHAERTSTHGLIVNAGFTRAQNRNLLEDEFKPPTPPTTIYSTSRPERPPLTHAALQSGAAGVGSWRNGVPAPTPYAGPFSDYAPRGSINRVKPSITGGVGFVVQSEQVHDKPRTPTHSLTRIPPPLVIASAESSPSIYPSSLPPAPADLGAEEANQPTPTSEIPPISIEPPLIINRQVSTISSQTNRSDAPQIPPRNPLRNSIRYRSRPHTAGAATTTSPPQLLTPQDSQASRTTDRSGTSYEPDTPPQSSDSEEDSSGSASSETAPQTPAQPNANVLNPFLDHTYEVKARTSVFPPPPPGLGMTRTRENFYTRRKMSEVRPRSSVEWKM